MIQIAKTALEDGVSIEIEADRLALSLRTPEDLRDAKIYFGDYIRLKGLRYGDLFYLIEEQSRESKVILIGNGTPYNGVTSTSDEGWCWALYNRWKVEYVMHIGLEMNGCWLHPTNVRQAQGLSPKGSAAATGSVGAA